MAAMKMNYGSGMAARDEHPPARTANIAIMLAASLMDWNKPIHLPPRLRRGFARAADGLEFIIKGPFDPSFEKSTRKERFRANLFYFPIHALAGFVLFVCLFAMAFEDSPRYDLPQGHFWNVASGSLFLLSALLFPILAIASIWATATGRVRRARSQCCLNLLLAVATLVSLLAFSASVQP